MVWILIAIIAILILTFISYVIIKNKKVEKVEKVETEIKSEDIDVLVKYVNAQKQENEQKQKLKSLKAAEQKEKLENFKRTKDQLKNQLKQQLDKKEWEPLKNILSKIDKGCMGVYVLHNQTKNKYYVGQSKEIYARIKKHFEIEQIALDYISGDDIKVKVLKASELNADYRIDHIEKTGIELFNANKTGYNKTIGNL